MSTTVTGRCACGAVRYEYSADPVFMGNCHCRDCQRTTGSAYVAAVGVPKAALKIMGTVQYHEMVGDSGKHVSRGFCPSCGSRLFSSIEMRPEIVGILAGSLDDPSIYKPTLDIFTSSAQPWDQMGPQTIKFPRMPQ
jgi:hypothetical protein